MDMLACVCVLFIFFIMIHHDNNVHMALWYNLLFLSVDDNVHFIIPLAHEYQVKKTLVKADKFLADQYISKGILKCNSHLIIEGILEAEKYGLTKTLGVLIVLASKKAFHYFSSANGYNEIQKDTLHEISMKRWKDNIDPNTGSPISLNSCKIQFR